MNAKMLPADDLEEGLPALSTPISPKDYDLVVAKNGHQALERLRGRSLYALLIGTN